jgi:hypothetical protein
MTETENVYAPIFANVRDRVNIGYRDTPIRGREHLNYKDDWAESVTTRGARGLDEELGTYHIHVGVREADLHRLVDTANPFTGEVLPFIVQNDSWTEWGETREDDVHHVLIEAEQLESAIEYVSTMMREILVPWDGTDSCNPKGMIAVTTDTEDWDIKYEDGELYSYDRS